MPSWMRAFRASFTFLTRIPVGGFPYPPKTWEWISIWFPLVGALLGGLQALLWSGMDGLSDPTRAIIVVGISMLLTGGFHEDGLADTFDALGGAYDPENVLRILKDSRVGAFGALALMIVLMLKISLLVDLSVMAPLGLVLGQSLSRAVPVIQLGFQSYVRRDDPESKSRDVARSGRIQALVAGFWVVLFLGIGWFWSAISLATMIGIVVSMVLVAVVFGIYVQRRVGGLTGDFLGAIQQLSELGILIVLVLGL